MKNSKFAYILLTIFSLVFTPSQSSAASGVSGGLTLLQPPSAKFSALAGASTGVQNEISGFNENPSVLSTLKTGQALFMYQKGVAGDAYGRFMVGRPRGSSGWGLSLAYYNAGDIELFDGVTTRTVSAQRDLALSLGYAKTLGKMDVGVTGKFYRSELIDTYEANAYAADLGLGYGLTPRLRIGAAMQNFGTQVTYISEGDDLPRIARAGLSYLILPKRAPTTLYLDAPYYMNEKELRPGLGVEVMVGPLAIRGGFSQSRGANEISVGTGFMLSQISLDYSLGVPRDLNAVHRFSMSTKFGSGPARIKSAEIGEYKVPVERKVMLSQPTAIISNAPETPVRSPGRMYVVQTGDTLQSIAQREYGSKDRWQMILWANKHLIDGPEDVLPGQRIILP